MNRKTLAIVVTLDNNKKAKIYHTKEKIFGYGIVSGWMFQGQNYVTLKDFTIFLKKEGYSYRNIYIKQEELKLNL